MKFSEKVLYFLLAFVAGAAVGLLFYGGIGKDEFGHVKINQDSYILLKELNGLKTVNKKVIVSTDEEIKINPRSRSAKLRIAEKTL